MGDIVEEIIKLHNEVKTTVDIIESNLTSIQEFYKDSNVFITGYTGFLGQVLVEKLLRSCPVSKIYVLMRNKKGKNIEERLNDIFDDALFKRIKNQFPERLSKVVAIEGDCAFPNLGICEQDRRILIDNVDIVFHVAATVRFDAKIKDAVDTNIRATRDLMRMARQMRLKSFLHISTAYSNCNQKVIEEDVYPPAIDYKDIMAMVDNVEENILEKITPRLIGKFPNTYTFTKQIAEDTVRQEGQGLPVGIHRPTIVIATYKEPIRGWSNSIYGAQGILLGAGVGLLRVQYADEKTTANLIPVDLCVNSMIAAAWDVSETFKKAQNNNFEYKPQVYNFDSSHDKRITLKEYMDCNQKYGIGIPPIQGVWYYSLTLQKHYLIYLIQAFFLHTVPAFLADGVLLCLGKPPMLLKAYKKIGKFTHLLEFFIKTPFTFKYDKVKEIIEKMTERDRKIFLCDIRELDWDEFFKCHSIGARVYLLKDPLSTLPEARVKNTRFYWAHQAIKVTLCALVIWAIWAFVSSFF